MKRRILGAWGHKIWRKIWSDLAFQVVGFCWWWWGVVLCPPFPPPYILPPPLSSLPLSCDCFASLIISSSQSSRHSSSPGKEKKAITPITQISISFSFSLPDSPRPHPLLISSSDSTGGGLQEKYQLNSSSMALTADAQFHVLAVDDSLLDRKLIERLLRTSSYQVTTVDSGSKALEFLGLQDDQPNAPFVSPYRQEIGVNLVITDYCMPGMTGYDLLKRIKGTSTLKDIPVVIMSSENVPSRINRCLEEGAEEFFLKPVQLSDVERLIPHIMKKKSPEEHKEEQLEQQQQPPQQQQSNHIDLCTAITTDCSSSSTTNNSSKRKAMEEALSPERRRPRCSVTA